MAAASDVPILLWRYGRPDYCGPYPLPLYAGFRQLQPERFMSSTRVSFMESLMSSLSPMVLLMSQPVVVLSNHTLLPPLVILIVVALFMLGIMTQVS